MQILFIPQIFRVNIELFSILLMLGIPVYLILRTIFRKFIKNDTRRKVILWTSTIIFTPVLYGSLVLLFIFYISYYPKHSFNKNEWMTHKEKRYQLSADIIKSKMLIGKNKSEVRALLGDEKNPDDSDTWNFYLGFVPELANIDPDILEVEFKNGVVVNVTQHNT